MSLLIGFDPEFEYADECYTYLTEREKMRPKYLNRSPELDYREDLIRRLNLLCIWKKLSLSVKYLSIYIMDYFMDNHQIVENQLELVLVCSLSIAAKVDEKDNNIPKYSELFSVSNQFSSEEVFEMESRILEFFNWIFLTPTVATYVDYFCSQSFKDMDLNNQLKVDKIVKLYLEKSIATKFYRFNPSVITASSIYCTRNELKLEPIWPKYVENVTKYSFTQIEDCVYELKGYDFLKSTKFGRIDDALNDSGFIELIN